MECSNSGTMNPNFSRGHIMKSFRMAVSAFIISFVSPTMVQAQGKPTSIWGAGGSSCASLVNAYDEYQQLRTDSSIVALKAQFDYVVYVQWIEGYLAGIDQPYPGSLRKWDGDGLQLWIYNFCKQHPLEVVTNAGLAFYKEIGGRIYDASTQRWYPENK